MLQSLKDIAGAKLPEPLQTVYRCTNDPVDVALAAERFADVRVAGRVGPKPFRGGAQLQSEDVLRVDCFNNPEFWLEVNLGTMDIRGQNVGIRDSSSKIRINHTAAMWFWLDVHFNAHSGTGTVVLHT